MYIEQYKSEFNILFPLNLQFFAKDGPGGEKTEEPTSKKKKDTRKEGKVAKSQELGNAFMLIGMFLVLKFACGYLGQSFIEVFYLVYNRIPDILKANYGMLKVSDISYFIQNILIRILIILAPFFVVGVVVGFVINLVQVKWTVTAKPLQPKLSKLNPIKGFGKIFSAKKIVELIKSIVKIIIIGGVCMSMLKDQLGLLITICNYTINDALQIVGAIIVDVGMRISIIYLILAFADYGYQKWTFHQDIKMTKQEVKDEYKNSEGDPAIKGKQKQRMMEAARRRMMSDVPQADVVITNPTHFAVALKYDNEVSDAPIVTAKGADLLAKRIKEIAKENDVEIVENKPLARMLYHNVPVGGMVPPELYQAVAEVLAFVYNIKEKKGKGSPPIKD